MFDRMAEEKPESEFIEDFQKTIRALVDLHPTYNSLTRALRDTSGKPTSEVSQSYPEILNGNVIPALTEFGLKIGGEIDMESSCIADDILTLTDRLEDKLDDDEVRNILGSATSKRPPNPRRDYIENCVNTLSEEDETTLRVLRMAARESYSADFSDLAEKAQEEYGMDLDEDTIRESGRKLDNLGLLDDLSGDSMQVKDDYKAHIIEIAEV